MAADLFPGIPADARLWVIALDSRGEANPAGDLEAGLAEVLGKWRHKGDAYQAAWELLEDRLILVVEPRMATDPSGCAIDGMLRKLHRLAETHGRSILAEDSVLVRLADGLRSIPRDELAARIADGTLQAETPVVDRSLHHLGQLREGRLEKPLSSTWIGRKYRVVSAVHS